MISLLSEKRRLFCFLGILVALAGLSLSDLQPTVTVPAFSYVSFSGRIVWSSAGFAIFLAGDLLFFTSLVLLLEGKKIREAWVAQISKAGLFTLAFLILVQRTSGYTSLEGPGFGVSVYLENFYTDMTQYLILFSIFTTLTLVTAADFLLRRDTTEKPSEHFYLSTGICNFALGTVMAASVLLKGSNYSFYPFLGNFYFYTQQYLFKTVDAFETLGIFTAALGCAIIAFKGNPPQIHKRWIVVGATLLMTAAPLNFTPIQIWIEQSVFNSSLLASFNLGKIDSIFPLNLNFFTYISLIIFMIGMLVYLRVSKLKMIALTGFVVYMYFFPSLSYSVLSRYEQPLTPTIPPSIYAGLAVVLAVTAIPVASQWSILDSIRGMFKSSKTAVLLIVAGSLLAYLIFTGGMVASTPQPTAQQMPVAQQKLNPDDKIDPRLLNLSSPTGLVPVILRFRSPISNESMDSLKNLNDSYIFQFNDIDVYEDKCYYAIHGNVNATTTGPNFLQTLRELVVNYTLSYLLYNEGSSPPDIENHYIDYFYVDADILHALNLTGRGTTVAIIDSGINDYLEDIKGKTASRIIYQVNFLTRQEGDPLIVGDITPESFPSHATHIAALMAGAKGIAPEANIIDLKVKSDNGQIYYTTYTYITEAIYWCISNKDRFNISVINLAVGNSDQLYGSLTEAVDRAFLNGIVVITGAGSRDFKRERIMGALMTPAIADWGITVAATNDYFDRSWSPISPTGPSPHWYFLKPDISAPILYTSSATGLVSGAALLLVQQCNEEGIPPVLRAAMIRWALISGAQEYDLGPPGWDILFGFGRVNALSSYLFLKNHLTL
nr:S8 family serine peptidase [Candidatus Freyarchaeota archaeon]